jgi:xylulokinase
MYIGIDLGTSGVKGLLIDDEGKIIASCTEAIEISRPRPLWSEQHPDQWWSATDCVVRKLSHIHSLSSVKAIGLSGQMHGATLLDKNLFLALCNDSNCLPISFNSFSN